MKTKQIFIIQSLNFRYPQLTQEVFKLTTLKNCGFSSIKFSRFKDESWKGIDLLLVKDLQIRKGRYVHYKADMSSLTCREVRLM